MEDGSQYGFPETLREDKGFRRSRGRTVTRRCRGRRGRSSLGNYGPTRESVLSERRLDTATRSTHRPRTPRQVPDLDLEVDVSRLWGSTSGVSPPPVRETNKVAVLPWGSTGQL